MTRIPTFALCASLLLCAAPAAAGSATIEVAASRTALVTLPRAARSVVIGNPKIADVSVEGTTQVVVFGKAPGGTTLTVFGPGRSVLLTAEVLVRAAAPGDVTVTYGAGRNVQPGGHAVTYACDAACTRVPADRATLGGGW
ncbi:conserved exported hypothetical protein [uncultured Alphaproteobacteria bacterium]|uniref:Pilus formation protein N-terminal domain-containing protein n=1 Tax=uncultured Alphaproteobacteria bacterium TaxID=91750 RepID=A0A212KIZ5_9PROT|nr:conserved exported hypothetical protein [uncultured Alphaproteobacteria bacterium]